MHRNLGVFTTRKVSLERLFLQFQGKENGFTKGRDRSFHFGSKPHNIVGMISHLGPQLGVANGIALDNLLKKNKKVFINWRFFILFYKRNYLVNNNCGCFFRNR